MAPISRAQRTFLAFQVRNFRWYFGAQTLSQIGSWFQMIAQMLLVANLTGSGVALGLVTALQALPVLFLSTYGGALADRLPTRRLLIVTQSSLGAVALAMALMSASGTLTVNWIYAFALLSGTINAIDRPASQAFLFELVGPDHLTSAIGLNSVQMSMGRLVGPAVGALIYASAGAGWAFGINALSFALVVVALLVIRKNELIVRIATSQTRAKVMDGIRYVRGIPDLYRPLIASAVVGCLAFNFLTVMTAMVKFEFDAGDGALGAVESLNALFAVGGGLIMASVHKPTIRLMGLVTVVFAGSLTLNALAPSLGWYLAVMPIFGLSVAAWTTIAQAVVQRNAEPEMQGRVAGLYQLAIQGTSPVGAILAGFLIDISPRAAFGMGATGTLAAGVGLLWATRHDRPTVEPGDAAPDFPVTATPVPSAVTAVGG